MVTRGKQMDTGYLAGIIDGEGSICLNRQPTSKSYQISLMVANTYLPLLEAIQTSEGGRVRNVNMSNHRPTWKPVYRWHTDGVAALPTLRKVLPYLIVKRAQCLLAIEVLETLSPGKGGRLLAAQIIRREEILAELKRLNARGRAAATTERESAGVVL